MNKLAAALLAPAAAMAVAARGAVAAASATGPGSALASPARQPDLPLLCGKSAAQAELLEGYRLQAGSNTQEALAHYERCLAAEPNCVSCLYEMGWSYWRLGQWSDVVRVWEAATRLQPQHAKIRQFLPSAKESLAIVGSRSGTAAFRSRTAIFTESAPQDAPISMTLVGRRQSYDPRPENPLDRFDEAIFSPKSAILSPDGKRAYVNALEGAKTLVYDTKSFELIKSIEHVFGPQSSALFQGPVAAFGYAFPKKIKKPLEFSGKPVEAALSHGGRFLWVPYYRRSFDTDSTMPSALALIDTGKLEIARVFATGPIAKYVEVSPDGNWLAVSHWGDNTVGLFDIRGDDPKAFAPARLLVVERRLNLSQAKGDRDRLCGYCLRGLAFSRDSQYLFIARMSGGGFAIFDLRALQAGPRLGGSDPVYLGTVKGIIPGPRDIHIDASGEWLYASCNASGTVIKAPARKLIEALAGKTGRTIEAVATELGVASVFVGLGARTIKLAPDGKTIFAAVNASSEVVAIDAAEMKVVSRVPVDSYPVGLAVSPDGLWLWVTSQGRNARGGNSVSIYSVRYKGRETVPAGDPALTATATATRGG